MDGQKFLPDDPILCLACVRGHYNIALFLLDSGAHIVPNSQGLYPLHLTSREGFGDLSRLLIQQGAPVDPADWDLGWTPLFYAASEGHVSCIKVLLESGCKVDAVDDTGRNAVYYAANDGHIACVNMLLAAGCVASLPEPMAKSLEATMSNEEPPSIYAAHQNQDQSSPKGRNYH